MNKSDRSIAAVVRNISNSKKKTLIYAPARAEGVSRARRLSRARWIRSQRCIKIKIKIKK